MACRRNLVRQFIQPGQIQSGVYKSWRQVPSGSNAMGVEPVGDHFRAVAARKVVKFWSFSLGSFLRRVQQILPMLGFEIFAELAEKGLHFVGGLLQVDRKA